MRKTHLSSQGNGYLNLTINSDIHCPDFKNVKKEEL